jgi:hypothetical protein
MMTFPNLAETKGRWWIVGSAWSNVDSDKKSNLETSDVTTIPTKDKLQNEKLLEKARALGMNTETRKTIFCILMTAEVIQYFNNYTIFILTSVSHSGLC